MEKNLSLTLEYEGTNYYGWQVQNHKVNKYKPTVQGELERALAKLFRIPLRVSYAGRTDRGVHAKDQVVNFKIKTTIPLENIRKALNSFLPPDINIKRIKYVPLKFHSRFSVKSKIYRYLILNNKNYDVFLRNYSWQINDFLDVDLMKKASQGIIGKKDFSIFAKQPDKYKSCFRRIKKINIRKKGKFIRIDIEADGFLRGMARNIVSLLVNVGKKKVDIDEVEKSIKVKEKSIIGKPAPPQGLYLWKVYY